MQPYSGDSIPTMSEALSHLIESIALEEKALSQLVVSEANKIEAFVGKQQNFPLHPSSDEIIRFNHSVISVLDSIQMAEWLLFKKLHTISQLSVWSEEKAHLSSVTTTEDTVQSSVTTIEDNDHQDDNGSSDIEGAEAELVEEIDEEIDLSE
ncbi:hypothetical protein [Paenibacillus sp. L3-i20]|uniref:hypothetical protein n=1 Tax=Paenibacillus sp. L3-i20 TaxID=2905833 RepID=UPI001EE13823|nr:hypothetical protein [Paenibacillus sp. L3-i20]GKU78117.1 hypothetical protein L3i20_v225140 [Paenibacillus sp. L3-i20]